MAAAIFFFATQIQNASAQKQRSMPADTVKNYSSYKRGLTANALLIGYYGVSLTDSVDINGLHSLKDSAVNNSFGLRYVRISGRYQINDRFDATVLVNLVEFKTSPQGKILENAFLRYKFNDFATLQFGQFRPYFGIEDLYGIEQHKSYYWSNQYGLMNRNNWMGFQLGAAVFGNLSSLKIPLKYYFNVYNGNARNAEIDNDNSKDFCTRLEYNITKNIILGANFATTKYMKKSAGAFTTDLQTKTQLNDKWDLETESSFATGHNIREFMDSKLTPDLINNYKFRSFYVTPLLRCNMAKPRVRAMEISCRYETLTENLKNKNARNTFVPMLSFIFADNNAAKLSVIGVIDRYDHNIRGTSKYSQNQLIAQFQLRF